MRRSPLPLSAAALALLALGGCFEPPVLEDLTLEIGGGDRAVATIVTRLDPGRADGREADKLRARYREALMRCDDPWEPVLRRLEPIHDRVAIERVAGEVVRVERRVDLEDLERLPALFSADAVKASLVSDGPRRWLSLVPAGSLAEAGDGDRFDRSRPAFLAAARRYLDATGALYRLAERHPERRLALLGLAFEDLLSDEERGIEDEGQPVEGEEAVRDEFQEASNALATLLFDEPKGEGVVALEWVSRRLHHPFRARLRVRVEGVVEEVEGFVPAGDGRDYLVPELSLLESLARATSGVVEPLPLRELALHLASGVRPEPVPLAEIAALRLSAGGAPPDLAERLDAALRPPGAFRLVWTVPVAAPED